jgi:CubicO group peptidase (beta-lactamase class C family)
VTVVPGVPISGAVDPRFDAVHAAFAENFARRGEMGASLCVMVGGTMVVDLWGGWKDAERRHPWERDTLVNVFSVGKAVTALAVARLVGQGALGYDEPVARLWPEFAAGGKAGVTLRQLLSHQAGLPAVRQSLPPGSVFDWTRLCDVLAAHEPWWEPGTAHGYHVNTFGFLVGDVIRRASGRTPGAYIRREVTGPLDADFFIGVPPGELSRVAEFIGMDTVPTGEAETPSMERNAYVNPPELSGAGVINTTRWRTAQLPSTNGHASGRGIARIFAALLPDPPGAAAVVDPAVLAEATEEQVYGDDRVLHRPSRFGLGFQLTQPERKLGPNRRAFGHFGAGGSLGFCDPEARVAFGYAINTMGPRWQNPRNGALIDAVYASMSE